MQSVRAKKALGQHFLKDEHIAERIADTLTQYNLPVLEVGPGMGVLTQYLFSRYPMVKLVELDHESVNYLQQVYPELGKDLLFGDFLQMDLDTLFPTQPFMVIGNYPYNISSQIFFKILDYRDKVYAAAGMLQREVAARLASGPGSKEYGILSVLLQAWYNVEYLFTVDETVFAPPPKVKSGVIRLVRNERKQLDCNEALFKTVVKTAFNQRRKTIRNSLKPLLGSAVNDLPAQYLSLRPEQLSVNDFQALTSAVETLQKQAAAL